MSAPSALDVLAGQANWARESGRTDDAALLMEVRAVLARLIDAAGAMNTLAKGPASGVTQRQKLEVIGLMDSALAAVGAK